LEKRFAAKYQDLERWHWWFRGRQRILESVLKREIAQLHMPLSARKRIVAVGCGPPEGLDWVVSALGHDGFVIGIDADRSGALSAPKPGAAAPPLPTGVAFAIASAEKAPLRTASCDGALALDVIEHLDDDAAALSEMARLVRPGGFLMVTVPALPSLWGNQDVVSHHKRRYTSRSLAAAFGRAGLDVAWQSYFNTALFPVIASVRWARRVLGHVDGDDSDFESGSPGVVNDALTGIFACERHLVGRVRLPVGVSLIAVSRVP
jgi:SAM-dependent methyltransferase